VTKSECLHILKTHNEWRRGAEIEMLNPKVIGEALDMAIAIVQKARVK
jgi:hypothetical protein